MIELWTDGSCPSNGLTNAAGGWAYAIFIDDKLETTNKGKELNTTNQRMEMQGIIEGLKFIEKKYKINFEEIVVYTDSAYCLNCWQKKWWEKWINNGWVNSKKQPVKNKELWQELVPWFQKSSSQFNMVKVKGHNGIEKNELVDKLACEAAKS